MKRIFLLALAGSLTLGAFAGGKGKKKNCTNCKKTQCTHQCERTCTKQG